MPREGNAGAAAAQVLSVSLPGTCRAQGQRYPRPVSSVTSLGTGGPAMRSVACPQGFCGCKSGISIPNWCHSQCQHPAGSERLEVAAVKSSSVPDPEQQIREAGSAQSPRWIRAGGVPCPGHTLALGRGDIWWQWRGETRGGWFSTGWEMRPCSHRRTNPADSPAPTAGGQAPVPVCWRRDGAPWGSVPGCTLTNPSLGALC